MRNIIIAAMLFLSAALSAEKVWQAETIVIFPSSPLIKDPEVTDKITGMDVYNHKIFIVAKSNGFYDDNTIELSHMITYNTETSKQNKYYTDFYEFKNSKIANLNNFSINSVAFCKEGYDSLWTTHYINEASGVYFTKFNFNGEILTTKKFEKISFMDWQDDNNGVIAGNGLYATSNGGYSWDTLTSDINDIFNNEYIADLRLLDNTIYILSNKKNDNKISILIYDTETNDYNTYSLGIENLFHKIKIKDNDIYLLGGNSRNQIYKKYFFLIYKFDLGTKEFSKILDIKSPDNPSGLTHLNFRDDTLRAFSSGSLIYAESIDNGINWETKNEIAEIIENKFEDLNYSTDNIIVGFDTIYVNTDTSIIRIHQENVTSIKSNSADYFSVYPNPASDYIEISLGSHSVNKGLQPLVHGGEIAIYDVLGNVVEQTSSSVHSGGTPELLRIDISHLPKGVYFVRIGERVEKFVKR